MDELTSRTARCSGVASRCSTIAASPPSPPRSTRPYCFGSSGSKDRHRGPRALALVSVDELPEKTGRQERCVAGEHEHVLRSALERAPSTANGVSGPERYLLHCDLEPVEGVHGRGRGDDDDRVRPEHSWLTRAPSRPYGGRAGDAGASGRRSASASRDPRPLRPLRASTSWRPWLTSPRSLCAATEVHSLARGTEGEAQFPPRRTLPITLAARSGLRRRTQSPRRRRFELGSDAHRTRSTPRPPRPRRTGKPTTALTAIP